MLMRKFNSRSNKDTQGVPAEPSAPPESFARANFSGPPPGGLVGDSPTISTLDLIVNIIRPYSENTQKEALKEMIHRLKKEFNYG